MHQQIECLVKSIFCCSLLLSALLFLLFF